MRGKPESVGIKKSAEVIESHFGSLKDAPLFHGRDPVAVQREMRDEWR